VSVQVNIRGERYGVTPPLCGAGNGNELTPLEAQRKKALTGLTVLVGPAGL